MRENIEKNNMDFMRNLEEKENEMIRKKNTWQDIVPIMQEKDKKLSKAKIFQWEIKQI